MKKAEPFLTLPLEIREVVDITNYELTSKLKIYLRNQRFGFDNFHIEVITCGHRILKVRGYQKPCLFLFG
jgi:hypothetical protein